MKIRSIEVLRGLAAFSVAVAHADSFIGGNTDLPFSRWHDYAMPGTAGVEFFFVLSGFVMAVAHGAEIGPGGRVARFLWKRFCRIYPLYWLVLAWPVHSFWGAPSVTPAAIAQWASLLPVRTDNLVVVAWTLRQEVTFYLVLSLCLLPRIGRPILALWIAATTIAWFIAPIPSPPGLAGIAMAHILSIFNFEFFAGLAAGWLWRRAQPTQAAGRTAGSSLLAAGFVLLAWRMSRDGWGVEYGPVGARPVYGTAYAAIILGCALLERTGVLRFGPRAARVAWLAGAASYPLYLVHLPVLDLVATALGRTGTAASIGPDATFATLLASAVLAGLALALAVDQPLQHALRRLTSGNRSRRPAPG